MRLLPNARHDVPFILHSIRHTLVPIGLRHPKMRQNHQIEHTKHKEASSHQRTLHRPCLLITAEKHLEKTSNDDEHTIRHNQSHLGRHHLCITIQTLLPRFKHSGVIHPRQEFMPRTQARQHIQEHKQQPSPHLGFRNIHGDAHQTHEHHQFHPMQTPFERTRFPHLTVQIGLHHPRQKEQSTIQGSHPFISTKLQEHQHRHEHHHCRRYLLCDTKTWNPNPRAILFLLHHSFVSSACG